MFLARSATKSLLRPRMVPLATPANFAAMSTMKFGRSASDGVDVYLGNLDGAVTAMALKKVISSKYNSEFGGPRIVFNKIEKKSMGFGYITLPSADAANEAVAALKGIVMEGKEIKVELSQERRALRAAFFGNLSADVTEEELVAHVDAALGSAEGASAVSKVHMGRNADGTTRGFAHIDFNDSATRDRALEVLQGAELKGRPLKVDKASVKTRLPVIYIGNISYDVTVAHLEQMLDEVVGQGNFSDIKLHIDRVTGYPRGFAHVTFASRHVGNKAIAELNGIEMMGRPLRASFAAKRPDAGKRGGGANSDSEE